MPLPTIPAGIDCSDGEVRAALWSNGQLKPVSLGAAALEPAVYCDRMASDKSLGVAFPSILRNLGNQRPISSTIFGSSIDEIFCERFKVIRNILFAAAGGGIHPIIFAVPAGLTTVRRKHLLELMVAAGLGEVELMDRCLAAAIGHRTGAEGVRTLLVAASGHGGVDLSLLRLGKGRTRVLGSQCVNVLGDEHLAEICLELLVLRLRKENIFLGLKQLAPLQWLQLYHLTNEKWRKLSLGKVVDYTLPKSASGLAADHRTELDPAAFAEALSGPIEVFAEAVRGLVDSAKLELSDVEEILLIGSIGDLPAVVRALQDITGRKPSTATANLVAFGAAIQAGQQSIAPPAPTSSVAADDPAPAATAPPEPSPVTPPPETFDHLSLSSLREIIARGDYQAALPIWTAMAKALAEMGGEIQRHLGHEIDQHAAPALSAPLPKVPGETPARRGISAALEAIAAGHHVEGVQLAHQAYATDKNDPEVFTGMMRAHIDAALALSQPQQYLESIHFLECARNHDQTDRAVSLALGRRHLLHAQEMRRLNNHSAARECVKKALFFDPKNQDAITLHADLVQESQAE